MVIGFICLLMIVICKFFETHHMNGNSHKQQEHMVFLTTFKLIIKEFSSWILLLSVIILLIFNPFNANYYDVIPPETLFASSYYSASTNNEEWIDWLFVFIALLFEFCILYVIIHLHKTNNNQRIKNRLLTEEEMAIRSHLPSDINFARNELEQFHIKDDRFEE